MPIGSIRAVSFDAGETLIHPHPSFGTLFHHVCVVEGVSLPVDTSRRLEEHSARYFDSALQRGGLSTLDDESSRAFWGGLYRSFLSTMGVSKESCQILEKRLYDVFRDSRSYRPFDDAIPTLKELRDRGFRIGLISNWESWLDRLLVDLDVKQYFDAVVISGDVGFEKPDPRIYARATELLGVQPHEILHVGDSLHADVLGATRCGWEAVLLDRHGRSTNEAVARCLRLDELLNRPELERQSTRS